MAASCLPEVNKSPEFRRILFRRQAGSLPYGKQLLSRGIRKKNSYSNGYPHEAFFPLASSHLRLPTLTWITSLVRSKLASAVVPGAG